MNGLRISWAALLLVGATTPGIAQTAGTLANLTLPPGRLPAGCGLMPGKPPMTAQGGGTIFSGGPLSALTNPWSGSDRKASAQIRKRMDGVPLVPDAPLDRQAAAAYEQKWTEDVVEAYRAAYQLADETQIEVLAVRFNDPALARPKPPAGMRSDTRGLLIDRIVLGATVVVVSASRDSACYQAIGDYVRSLR